MRASFLAMCSILLAVAIAQPEPAAAEYPFDSLPALPPLAGGNAHADTYGPYPSVSTSATVPLDQNLTYSNTYGPAGGGPAYGPPGGETGYGPPGDELGYGPPGGDPYLDRSPFWDRLFPGPPPLWVGYVSSTYMGGTERSLWNGDLFLPLWQNGQALWFWNMRGQVDNDDAGEFNIGTGIRALARPGLVVGTYLYYDRLHSANDNGFSQGTFGVEVMDVCWDARFNVYFPESKGKPTSSPPRSRYSDGTIVVSSGEERAYWGFDLESGALLGAWGPNAQHELRGFCGIYHFDSSASGFDNITGPRARLEWRYHDLPMFGNGSRLTCGLTLQADTERGGDAFAFIGLRIPLDPCAHTRPPLSRLQRRMVDPVVRDIDIVTNTHHLLDLPATPPTGIPNDSLPDVPNGNFMGGLLYGTVGNSPSMSNEPEAEMDADACAPELLCPMDHHPPTTGSLVNIVHFETPIPVENVQNARATNIDLDHDDDQSLLFNSIKRLRFDHVLVDGVPHNAW